MSENLDLSKMLETIGKMDKKELEEKLKQAQAILNEKNINPDKWKK